MENARRKRRGEDAKRMELEWREEGGAVVIRFPDGEEGSRKLTWFCAKTETDNAAVRGNITQNNKLYI